MTDTYSHSQSDQDDDREESGGEQQLGQNFDLEERFECLPYTLCMY